MNIFRKSIIGFAALAAAGTGIGVAATAASASGTQVVTATSQERTAVLLAPNVVAYTFNLYNPSVLPPGYRLTSTATEICAVSVRGKLCTWRLTSTGPGHPELTGNAVVGPFGQIGAITGGTGGWRGAHGVFRALNLIPGASTDTFVFTTP